MAKRASLDYPRRGEVYLISFNPTVGAEIRKTRPGLILQNDTANRYSPVTIVGAITSQFEEPLYPTEVLIKAREGGLRTEGVVLLNQIRSVDKRRLVKRLGKLEPKTMEHVARALRISLGLMES